MTAYGLRMQAAACSLDPDVRWNDHPRMQAFLSSAMEFGEPASA
jgi:hypothetical protein